MLITNSPLLIKKIANVLHLTKYGIFVPLMFINLIYKKMSLII